MTPHTYFYIGTTIKAREHTETHTWIIHPLTRPVSSSPHYHLYLFSWVIPASLHSSLLVFTPSHFSYFLPSSLVSHYTLAHVWATGEFSISSDWDITITTHDISSPSWNHTFLFSPISHSHRTQRGHTHFSDSHERDEILSSPFSSFLFSSSFI